MMGYYSMGIFGWLGMLLFWGFIILGIIFLWRTLDLNPKQTPMSSSKALDIARERYAKGELNKDEFDRLKHDLG